MKLIPHIAILHKTHGLAIFIHIFFQCLHVLCLFVHLFIFFHFLLAARAQPFFSFSFANLFCHYTFTVWRQYQQASAMYHSSVFFFQFVFSTVYVGVFYIFFSPFLPLVSIRLDVMLIHPKIHRRYHIVFDGPLLFILIDICADVLVFE